jgi:hypothetical protein
VRGFVCCRAFPDTVTVPLDAEHFASLTRSPGRLRMHDELPSLVKLAQRDSHVPHPAAIDPDEWAG